MAHKKAGGSSRNGRDTAGRRLGMKKFGGEAVVPGNIIVRQRGTKWRAGRECRRWPRPHDLRAGRRQGRVQDQGRRTLLRLRRAVAGARRIAGRKIRAGVPPTRCMSRRGEAGDRFPFFVQGDDHVFGGGDGEGGDRDGATRARAARAVLCRVRRSALRSAERLGRREDARGGAVAAPL